MYRSVVIMLVLAAAVFGGAAFVPTVAADDHGDDDEVPEPPNPLDDEDEDGEEEEEDRIVAELGDDLVLRGYEWDGRTIEMTFEADSRTTVAITDAGSLTNVDEGTVEEIPYRTVTIPSGETQTVEFTVGSDTRAVTVAADDSMIAIVEDALGFISGSATWSEVQAAAAGGIITGAGIPLLAALVIAVAGKFDHQRVF